MKKRLFIVTLFMLFVGTLAFSGSANGASYKSKALSIRAKGDCEDGPWKIHRDRKGYAYAFEWDTVAYGKDKCRVGLQKMIWSKAGKLSYKKVKIPMSFAKKVKSGNDINITTSDKYGNLYVQYKYNTRVAMMSKSGKLLADYDLLDLLPGFGLPTGYNLSAMYVKNGKLYIYMACTDSLYIVDVKKGKCIRRLRVASIMQPQFHEGYFYGLQDRTILRMSLKTGKVLQRYVLPEGSLRISASEVEDSDTFNKFTYDVCGKYMYATTSTGLYRLNLTAKNRSFKLLLGSSDCKYIRDKCTLCSLRVVKGRIYLLSMYALDDESPTDLCVYYR